MSTEPLDLTQAALEPGVHMEWLRNVAASDHQWRCTAYVLASKSGSQDAASDIHSYSMSTTDLEAT